MAACISPHRQQREEMAKAAALFPEGEQLLQATNARVVGTRPQVVVLAHGYGSNQSLWEPVLPAIMNRYKVLLFDWPGSSTTDPACCHPSFFTSFYSYARLLLALLDQFDIQTCSFVGHSMSGMIGCIASVMQPLRFQRLVLVGASPRYLNDADYYGGFEKADTDQLFAWMESDFHGWAANFATLVVGVNNAQAVNKFAVTLSSMQRDVAITVARTIFESDYRHMLAHVRTKTYILQTAKDLAVPAVVGEEYMKQHIGRTVHKQSIEADEADHGSSCNESRGKIDDNRMAPSVHQQEAPSLVALPTEGHLPQLTAPQLLSVTLQRILCISVDIPHHS